MKLFFLSAMLTFSAFAKAQAHTSGLLEVQDEQTSEWMQVHANSSEFSGQTVHRYPVAKNTCRALNQVLQRQGFIDLSVRFLGFPQRNYLTPNHGTCRPSRTQKAYWKASTVRAKDGACSLGYQCVKRSIPNENDRGDND